MPFHYKEKLKSPQYLYYYCPFDDYAVDILEKKRLFLKSPKDFNDPFDCNAFSLRIGSAKFYRRGLLSDLKKTEISKNQKKRIRQVLENKLYEEDAFWPAVRFGMQSEIEKAGVFSFAERFDNFLLWSHYADKHKGICFEFEFKYMPIDLSKITKVNYKKQMPIIQYSQQKNYHSIFDTKSNIWKYEKEWRAVVNGKARTHVQFGNRTLNAVICGIGMVDNDIHKIIGYCLGFPNKPRLFKALRSARKFQVQFEEIIYFS
jgi:hypothetical protein